MAVGFGSLWNDTGMGEHWMVEPNATVRPATTCSLACCGRFSTVVLCPRPRCRQSEEAENGQQDKQSDKPRDSKGSMLKGSGPGGRL